MTVPKKSNTTDSEYKNNYQKNWDSFYSDKDDEVFWDSTPSEKDIEYIWCVDYFNRDLPVLDLGCGSAIRSQFLKSKFERVIGVDVSQYAIEKARKKIGPLTDIRFEVFDATDVAAAEELHEKEGDVNIYIRGVWHVMTTPEDKQNFARTLKTLIGAKGVIVLNELDDQSMTAWSNIFDTEGGLPPGFQKVIRHQIKPGDISEDQVIGFFKDYSILSKKTSIKYTHRLTKGKFTGELAEVPSFLMRITKK